MKNNHHLETQIINYLTFSDLLDDILAPLTGRQLLYTLLRLMGHTIADIAQGANSTETNVHANLKIARKTIKRVLKFKYGIEG